MADGKSTKHVEIREPKEMPIRLFRNREPIEIDIPSEVVEGNYTDVPQSVTITPMTRIEAVKRDRLKKKLDQEGKRAITKCGVSYTDYLDMIKELAQVQIGILDLDSGDLNDSDVAKKADELKDGYTDKWQETTEKLYNVDTTAKEAVEDLILEDAVQVLLANCKSITDSSGTVIDINADTLESIHNDLFFWIISKIEENSYLKTGEVTGLR